MTKVRLTKIIAILVVFVMAITMLTACGKTKENPETATSTAVTTAAPATTEANLTGWQKNKEKAVTLDWYWDDGESGVWGQDKTSQYITEKTGVTINFITNPNPGTSDKINTLIASDSLPDIFSCGHWQPYILPLIQSGTLWSYNDLADTYDKSFWDTVNTSTFEFYKEPDGKVYQVTNWTNSIEQVKQSKNVTAQDSFMVREDIYKAIGEPSMKTPDEFIAALQAAKEKFPSVNGQPLVPFMFAIPYPQDGRTFALVNFARIIGISEEYSKTIQMLDQPDYVTWIKAFRKAYSMGLIPQSIFIDNEDAINEKIVQGRVFTMVGSNSGVNSAITQLYDSDNSMRFMSIDNEPAGSNPPRLAFNGGVTGYMSTMVSKTNKDPERTINFITYLRSVEGQKDVVYGSPSDLWTEDSNGVRTWTQAGIDEFGKGKDVWAKGSGIGWVWNFQLSSFYRNEFQPAVKKEPSKSLEEFTKGKIVFEPQFSNISPDADTPEKKNELKIFEFEGKTIIEMITAPSDEKVDELLAAFKKFRDDNGYAALKDVYYKKIAENKVKFSMD